MASNVNEFNALRAEILTWIQIEYALVSLSAVAVATVLACFRPESSSMWPMHSMGLLVMLSCIGILTNFSRSKINTIGAYIKIFHRNEGEWEDNYDRYRKAYRRDVVLGSHGLGLFLLYTVLAITSIIYPYGVHMATQNQTPRLAYSGLGFGLAMFLFMIFSCLHSYNKNLCIKRWEALRDDPALGQ